MILSELTAYTYTLTERLAFPRLVGSSGEKKALGLINKEFMDAGFKNIHREQFKTSFFTWTFISLSFIVSGILLVVLSFSSFMHPYISLAIILISTLAALKALLLLTTNKVLLWKNDRKNIKTENLYVKLKGKNAKARIVFLAHWDSKSQRFPSIVRAIILIISFMGAGFLFFLYTLISINCIFAFSDMSFLSNIAPGVSGAFLLITLLNLANRPGNNTPGALDNAQSLASIIALARHYHEVIPENLNFTFLSTGSEELNLGGAIDYISRHEDELAGIPTFFINLDGVGCHGKTMLVSSYGIPRKFTSKKLNGLFTRCANELDIPIKNFYVPTGAWADHIPLIKKGFEACWVTSEKGFYYFHTPADNMSQISPDRIEDILKLCLAVVGKLDDEYSAD